MNPNEEPSSSKGPILQDPFNRRDELTPEILKMFKECRNNSLFLIGLPFALFTQVISISSQKGKVELTPVRLFKRGVDFCACMLLGTFFFGTPYCYSKIKNFSKNIGNQKEIDSDIKIPVVNEPETQADNFDYSTSLVESFYDPEMNFSSDLTSSGVITNDTTELNTTTYEKLRSENRSIHQKEIEGAYTSQVYEPEPRSSEQAIYSYPRSPKVQSSGVKRNKYGDEID